MDSKPGLNVRRRHGVNGVWDDGAHHQILAMGSEHDGQKPTPREMVRAHAYPVLAALSTISLIVIATLQIPSAIRNSRYNACVDEQIKLRNAPNLQSQTAPGKLVYLMAVGHCNGN